MSAAVAAVSDPPVPAVGYTRVELFRSDGTDDCPPAAVRLVRYRPGLSMPMHAHDVSSLTLFLCGGVAEDSPLSPAFVAGVADCIVKPAGSYHCDRFGSTPSLTLQIELAMRPHSENSRWNAGWAQRLALRGHTMLRHASVTRALSALVRMDFEHRSESRSPANDAVATRRLLSRACYADHLIDALGAVASALDPVRRPPPWLARAEREIENRLPGAVSVADVALALGLHPAHLTRVFQAAHGCGLLEFIRRRRVRRAALLLADARTPPAAAAVAAGFADQAHLTRAFREVLGLTPALYRSAIR